jgi:hypothetical protein
MPGKRPTSRFLSKDEMRRNTRTRRRMGHLKAAIFGVTLDPEGTGEKIRFPIRRPNPSSSTTVTKWARNPSLTVVAR